nr:MAG TPA: hypothetical protein [Caudoviricetes sp.]
MKHAANAADRYNYLSHYLFRYHFRCYLSQYRYY